jgi:hypothetical protein
MSRRLLVLCAVALPVVLALVWLGRTAWVHLRARAAEPVRPGILHEMGIAGLQDVSYVRVHFQRNWGRGMLELSPQKDGRKVRELLASLAGAVVYRDHDVRDDWGQVIVKKRNGAPVAINLARGIITNAVWEWDRFEAPGLAEWMEAVIRDPGPWLENSSLQPGTIAAVQADFGNGQRLAISTPKERSREPYPSFDQVRAECLEMVSQVDRRSFERIDSLTDEHTTADDLKPRPTLSDPVIYLQPYHPFEESVLVMACTPDDLPVEQYVIPYREDRFDVQKIALYITPGTGRFAVALIPKGGGQWYLALDSDMKQEELNRIRAYGRIAVEPDEHLSDYSSGSYSGLENRYHELAVCLHDRLSRKAQPHVFRFR